MKKSKTNLEYLMSLCNIRGVEISKYLHVDQSLVGKWKNGTRPLLPDSGYIKELTRLFAQRGLKQLEALFADIYKDEYNPEKIEEYAEMFICSSDPMLKAKTVLHKDLDADNSALYYSYNGVTGRKKAMDYLISCAQSAIAPTSIYLYDSTCFDWLINDEEYFDNWGKCIIELLTAGNSIYLILDSDASRAESLLYHFYLFSANRRFNLYYVDANNFPTAYIISETLAVVGYNDFARESFCTQLFTDYQAVYQQELYIRHLLKSRKKESIKRCTADECFDNIKNMSVISNEILMFSAVPTIYSMPEDLMEKVFEYNKLDEDEKNRLRNFNRLAFGEFFGKNKSVKCVFSLEELKKAASQKTVVYSDNINTDAALFVKSEDFKAHLNFLAQKVRSCENYQIGVIPKIELFGSEFSRLGYIACKNHCWSVISNEHSGAKALLFMNKSIVDLIFRTQEYVWKSIPQSYTDRENAADIIKSIAEGDN